MNYEENDKFFEEKCREIESIYIKLKDEKGWRFLMSSRRTLSADTDIALITLNPGGDEFEPPVSSCDGSAYLYEKWGKGDKSDLQEEIKELFKQLHERLKERFPDGKYENYRALMNNSLSAQYIPFRSKKYTFLQDRKKSEEFSKALWKSIFSKCIKPKLVITVGIDPFYAISKIMLDSGYELKSDSENYNGMSTGWGASKAGSFVKARFNVFSNCDGTTCTLIGLPHLSRFTIFTSKKVIINNATKKILDKMVENF